MTGYNRSLLVMSVEAIFKKAAVLKATGQLQEAFNKYMATWQKTEEIAREHSDATIDLRCAAMALGFISDHYADRHDFRNATAWRTAQEGFAIFMRDNGTEPAAEKRDEVLELFEMAHLAKDAAVADSKEMTEVESVRKGVMEESEDAEQIFRERLRRLGIEQADSMSKSWTVRMTSFIAEYPYIILFAFGLIGIIAAVSVAASWKPIPEGAHPRDMKKVIDEVSKNLKKAMESKPK